MVTVCAVPGSVYVVDALPLLSVVATGVPKVPPAPPSLKLTLTPGSGAPPFKLEANTVSAVGRLLPAPPL